MGEATTIACEPTAQEGKEKRASQNFATNQLSNTGKLIWHVITKTERDTHICFNVQQECAVGEDIIKFENIKDGTITPYEALRNLYISDPKNATGYFMVRVEACS